MNDTNDSLFDGQDSSNQRLVKDLESRYAPSHEDDQHLAHLRQRLFAAISTQNQPVENTSVRANGRSERNERRTRDGVSLWASGRGMWLHRMSQVAAVLFTALLVGALVLVFSHIPHNTMGATTGGALLAVRSFLMNDATTGWILTEQTVLRTTDGGSHWKNVTPAHLRLSAKSIAVFHNTLLAWIAVPQENRATTQLWHTEDGGTTWQSSSLPALFPRDITFVDALHGWLLMSQRDQQDAPAETIQVYRTGDGGKTWAELQTAAALAASTDAPPPGHLPYGGQKSGLHFLNATTGWVTGTVVVGGLSWLYVTHDAGATWQQQLLSLPTGEPSAQMVISRPIFFNAHDGLLPVTFLDYGLCIYVSHDGGTTWHPTSMTSLTPTSTAFADMQRGWITDGSSLLITADGGQQWHKQATSSSFQHITALSFISSTSGWAVSSQSGNASLLLKTDDGGYTWTPLP